MTRIGTAVMTMMLAAFCAAPSLAHHSFAMFDTDHRIELAGTIRSFEWTNPHCWIQLYVVGTDRQAIEWSIEGPSPNRLAREGWKSSTLKPGDKVTITANPLKSGEHGGSLISVTFPDGHVLGLKKAAGEYAPGAGK